MKKIKNLILKVMNILTPKMRDSIMFIPHHNCITDDYDIINYQSDNVLCAINSILKDNRFSKYTLLVGVYNEHKIELYMNYCHQLNNQLKVHFFNVQNRRLLISNFFKSRVILTDHPHHNFSYKTRSQIVISCGYFTPFKDDYFAIKQLSCREQDILRKEVNDSFDYHLVTSQLAGRIISTDTMLSFDKFIDMGFPRNDVLSVEKDNETDKKTIIDKLKDIYNIDFSNIICYTPTYRDYEKYNYGKSDSRLRVNKTIFGNDNIEADGRIQSILEEKNAIMIVKLHPYQEKSVLLDSRYERIKLYSEVPKEANISLYDILSVSDCLITDYTSTAFDFLLANKPILYYFYDYEKYISNRGFSFEPIQSMCAGAISYDYEEFIKHLSMYDKENFEDIQKRNTINSIINRYVDGKSANRLKDFILELK